MINQNKNNEIRIIGENIIINKGLISAVYVIPGFNYSIMNYSSVAAHVDNTYLMIRTMFKQNRTLKFCLSQIDIPITKQEITENLRANIRKWTTEDIAFEEYIKRGNYSQYVLEVFLEDTTQTESIDIKDLIKESYQSIISTFTPTVDMDNLERIFKIENQFGHIVEQNGGKRATRDIVFRYLMNNFFPGYGFPIDMKQLPYNLLLKNVDNYFTYNLGYFVTKNEFLASIGLNVMDKYCCIMEYTDFPQHINPTDLNLYNNSRIFIEIGDQQKLKTKVKRKQSDIEYTAEQNQQAGGNNEIEKDIERLSLAELIVYRIDKGELGCEATVLQMLSANSKQELDKIKKDTMVEMYQRDISCFPYLNQRSAYETYYKIRRPQSLSMLCDLKYVLSSKIDNFSNVGDFDSKDGIGLVRIGETI